MSANGSAPLIEFRGVTVVRKDKPVLDSIDLSIGVGEHVAILGPNGSGKSSLIKAITRECYPRQLPPGWSLRILGREVWNVFDLRVLLGIVSNDLMQTCTRDITGREAILSGFFSSIGIWPNHDVTEAMERKAGELLEQLEIPHLAERQVEEMSSGEARRVLIGRALVHEPLALVLDEPANSLDLRAVRELRSVLRKLAQSGTSLIMVTHHLQDIIPEISRVVMLKEGRVFRDGPKQQVLTSESLSALFDTRLELLSNAGSYQLLVNGEMH
jgi:iron complex transport system ATP-binding protein